MMETIIKLSQETYNLLQYQAKANRSTPEKVADTLIRLQLGNSLHIEQRLTSFGPQAYLRGTRVAVRHIAAFLEANRTAEEIVREDLSHVSAAAIYEAIAYYYDHQEEIKAELKANSTKEVYKHLRKTLTPEQFTLLTGQSV